MKVNDWKKMTKLLKVTCCMLGIAILSATSGIAQEPGMDEKAAMAGEAVSQQQWQVLATSPGVEVVSQTLSEPGKVLPAVETLEESPLEIAQDWLIDKGFEEGRNMRKGKLLYFSVGSAIINAKPTDKGFIDSRYLAFQRAELEAKAKTAISLGVDLTTSRGNSEREINPKERAELEEIVNTSPTLKKNLMDSGIAQDIFGMFNKAKTLVNAKLDQAISESGADPKAEDTKAARQSAIRKAEKSRKERLRNISEASLKASASAMADVQAMQVYQTFEGSTDGGYQIVVVSVWSLNLQKMVNSMRLGMAPTTLPKKKAKAEVTAQLPNDPEKLACLSGVRAYINQNGEHVLLSFGQAGVEVIGGRKDKAYELSGKKARTRAMAAIRNFMGESVAFNSTEELREVLALYAGESAEDDGDAEYKSISQFMENIKAEASKQKITGIHGLKTYKLTHPFTDKPMVLKVMAWSPKSQAMAQEVKQLIEQGTVGVEPVKPAMKQQYKKVSSTARKGLISSGAGADDDAL